MRQAYRVYDMSDNKKLHDVIAISASQAICIVEHITESPEEQLVVCDMFGFPIDNPHDEVLIA